MISNTAKEYVANKYKIKENFGRMYSEVDISCAVLLLREDWETFYRYMIHSKPNPIFLAYLALQMFDEGHCDTSVKLLDYIPDEAVYEAAETFKDTRYVFFKHVKFSN